MNIDSVLLFGALLVLLVFRTRYVFQKTGNPKKAFVDGFAYTFGFFSPFVIYNITPDGWVPPVIDKEIFSLVVALVIYAVLRNEFHFFLKSLAYIWKVLKETQKKFLFAWHSHKV